MPEKKRQKSYRIDCHDVAHLVEFCPFDWCSQLIAVATGLGSATRITIGTCRFPEENPELDDVEYNCEKDFHHGSRITAFAWSPQTSLMTMPKVIRFCTAGADKQLHLYTSDLKEDNKIAVVGMHKDYINSICFQPEKGELIASASDDHTCCVWSLDGAKVACLPLGAPGMSVCWHAEEPGKLMVAEKKGIIRFYNVETQRPIMSLDCGHMPLVSADWCHGNPLQVAAVAGTDWFVFDTSRSSRPLENKQAHPEGCRSVRWCRSHDHLLATTGSPAVQVKVSSIRTGHASLATQMKISYGLSWHYRLPLVAAGGDKQVHFWAVEPL